MWVALALVALIGSQQRVIPFDVWVDVESWRIVVIVQPHDKRTVKAIALQPLAAKKGAPRHRNPRHRTPT
jgi:hypothetical protein